MTGSMSIQPARARRGSGPRPMRTSFYMPKDNFAPIAAINTTPLVDVMLVLLIMFIMIIPVATHKVAIDVPTGPADGTPPIVHRLDIDAGGSLAWDGAAIGAAALAPRLSQLAADPARPVLVFNPDGETRYERVDELMAAIRRAGVTRLAFLNNSRFGPAIAR